METDHFVGTVGRALAGHTRDIVLLMQPDGLIVYANEAAALAYGYSPEEFAHMNIADLRAPSTHPLIEAQVAGDAEERVLYETLHVRRDGTHFPVEVSSRSLEVDGAVYRLKVARDISRRHDAQLESAELLRELESANRQLEGLLRIVSSALGRLDLDQLLHEVLEVLREVLDADAAVFLHARRHLVATEGPRGLPRLGSPNGFFMASGEGFASLVAEAGDVVWIADVSASDVAIAAHETYGIRRCSACHSTSRVACSEWSSARGPHDRLVSDAECVMLQVASDRIMSAVLGVQRYERTVRSQRFEAVLSEASTLLNSSHQLDTPIVLSLQMAGDALECEVAAFGPFRSGVYEIQFAIGAEPRTMALGGHPALEGDGGTVMIAAADSHSAIGAAVLAELGLAHAVRSCRSL